MRASGLVCVAVVGISNGCVDPLVTDEVDRSDLIFPAGTELPSAEDDPELAQRIGAADGIEGDVIFARNAFWDGRAVYWWDFGEASPLPIPLYLLVRESSDGFFDAQGKKFIPVPEHYPIFDKIPGDLGYSPWWEVVLVPVTDKYAGEILPSFAAVDEAERQGLVGALIPMPMAINCPVVLPSARLERVPGEPPIEPNEAYYRGHEIHYFDFDTVPVRAADLPVSTVYQLRREGGEPLSEPVRGVDLNADGDVLDTNDIFSDGPGDETYSGLVRVVEVVVVADTHSIDGDGAPGVTGIGDLFRRVGGELVPEADRVVAVYPQTKVLNRPIVRP